MNELFRLSRIQKLKLYGIRTRERPVEPIGYQNQEKAQQKVKLGQIKKSSISKMKNLFKHQFFTLLQKQSEKFTTNATRFSLPF